MVTDKQVSALEAMIKFPKGRMSLIKNFSGNYDAENWQTVETPYWVCRKMVELFPKDVENWVVFFSLEFLEVLSKEFGVSCENILMVSDTDKEAQLAKYLYKVSTVVYGKQTVNKESISNVIQGANMKFGKLAVVGNPPYQTNNDKGGSEKHASPLYHKFVEGVVDSLSPDYFSFIVPSRWMLGGRGLDKHRERMINDRRLKIIVDDMTCNGVFTTVDVAGGVNYFMWEKNYNGPCDFNGQKRYLNEYDVVIREKESVSILNKVSKISKYYMNSVVSQQTPYGIISSEDSAADGVYCWFAKPKGKQFVKREKVSNSRNDIHLYKVLAPKSPIAGQTDFNKDITIFNDNNIFIIDPNEVCSQTYLVINSFNEKELAENFIKYMKTKFFRYMLRMRMVSQDASKETYSFVPDMKDYSKVWTDKELYKKFELDEKEIEYIESKIKEI